MSKKGENIHKRKDGRWEARILRKDGNGISRYTSLYGRTYKDAKNKLLSERTFEKHVRVDAKRLLISTVISEWLYNSSVNLKKATRLKYKVLIDNHIIPELGNYDIRYVNENVINNFLAKKLSNGRLDEKGGLSNSYVKTMGIILTSVFNYAISKEYCEPLKSKIIKPSTVKSSINIMNMELQIKLERRLQYDDSITALGIMIALNTGLRIGEICALKWEDIDLNIGIIYVRHTIARVQNEDNAVNASTCLIIDKPKTKSSLREIPITSKLLPILLRAKAENPRLYVVSEGETFISPRTFEYRFHRVLEKHQLPRVNFHSLRHSFATRCIELDVDVKTLSEILGHSNVGITLNTYVHPSLELKRNQLEKLVAIGSKLVS